MRHPRTIAAIVGLTAAAVVGGVTVAATAGGSTTRSSEATTPSTSNSSTPSASVATSGAQPAAMAATIHTATAAVNGMTESILVNGQGLPLYFYKPDTATKSMVTGTLASLWPPLTASAPTESGASGIVKAVSSSNGRQVTYNGHFLYTFVDDGPGRVSGQGVQDFFVATPGLAARHSSSSAASTAPAAAGNGYGY